MFLIVAHDLAVDYGGRTIFSDVSLEIAEGDRIGVVGENGAGKSTLLRLLAGAEPPSEGQVTYSKGTRIGYLVQEPHFAPSVTVWQAVERANAEIAALAEQLAAVEHDLAAAGADHARLEALLQTYGTAQQRYEQLGGYDYDARVRRVLAGLQFAEDDWPRPAEALSGGQKKLLGLAQLLITEPDVLLLDEPDNHLDFAGKAFLEEYIREYHGAVALISHDRYLLDQVAQRIFEVEDGALGVWSGGYTAYVEQKETHLLRQRELYQVQQEELRRQEEAMYRLVQWARQNPKFAGRAENMKKQVARKREEMMDRPRLVRRRIQLDFGQHEGSRRVVTAADLTVRAGGTANGRLLLDGVAFEVSFGERVGIVGPNGSGKSTLLRVVAGALPASGGAVKLGATVRLGYYAQEQETLPPDQTPLEWIRQQQALSEQAGITRLRKLLLTYEDMHAPIARLSGGQKARLQFERLMLGAYNFLVLDEPTNNIDIPSAEVLESALQEFEGTVLIVSHDRYLLDHAVDRILELPGDGTIHAYPGNYTYYLDHRPAPDAPPAVPPTPPAPSAPAIETPPPPRPSSGETDARRPTRTAPIRRVRVALLGPPGTGKRTLTADLRGASGDAEIWLREGVAADIEPLDTSLAGWSDAVAAARRADVVLLAQDMADPTLSAWDDLRRALARDGVRLVPSPLPVQIKARGKGGLVVRGGTEPAREAAIAWCRSRQIAHADITLRDGLEPEGVREWAEAAWQRAGAPRASRPSADATFRPALVLGTRYDEAASDWPEAQQRLAQAVPVFGHVAVSALDEASIARAREMVAEAVGVPPQNIGT